MRGRAEAAGSPDSQPPVRPGGVRGDWRGQVEQSTNRPRGRNPPVAVFALVLGLCGCLSEGSPTRPPRAATVPPAPPFASATSLPTPLPISTSPPSPLPTSTRASPSATPSEVPAFSHVFIIVMENKEYSQIVGNSQAPTIQSLIQRGGLLTNYFAIRHPSLPNYLAMVAGSTFNLSRDCDLCHVDAPNLADQIEAAGRQWKAYNEDIPAPCFGVSVGEFDKSHDPFLYFDSIRQNPERCAPRVVALDSLPTDLASANPPDLMWIVPNLCHTMHDCDIAAGDAWLAQWIPLVTRSPAFQNGGVLFLTFDEGLTDRGCCGAAGGGQIATIVLSPWVTAGTHDGTLYTHYSLLRTIEEAWGFSPLGAAAGATPITGIWRSPASESR